MPTKLEQELQKSAEYLQQRLEKQGQNPLEGVLEAIPDEAKTALRNAVIGGLLGGGGGAYAAGPENRLKGLLTGAGLGAAAGGGATLGSQLLSGQISLPGEETGSSSWLGRGAGGLAGLMAKNPALTAGTGLGAGVAALKGPRISEIQKTLQNIVNESNVESQQKAALKALKGIRKIQSEPRMPYLRSAVAPGWAGQNPFEMGWTTGAPKGRFAGLKRVGQEAAERSGRLLRGTVRETGRRAGDLGSSLKVNRVLKEVLEPAKQLVRPSRAAWALAPLGLMSGYLLDKYIKGEY